MPSSPARARRARQVALCAALVAWALAFAWPRRASAHPASDGYLTLELAPAPSRSIEGQWDVPLADLDGALAFSREPDGSVQGAAVRARQADIVALVFGHLALHADGAVCALSAPALDFVEHPEGLYVRLPFDAVCPDTPRAVDLDYTLFFDRRPPAPEHRGLVRIRDGTRERSVVFSSGFRHERFTRDVPDRGEELGAAIRSGVSHIGSGMDHLLFLLALLLPSVLRREDGVWKGVETLRAALVEVAKIVTAFTVAHSITLSLSALDVVRLPPRIVEPAIAASVVVAALQNVVPRARVWPHARWRIAFVLGLLHGFGFSAAILELGLGRRELLVTLFGFNVGVELGQVVVVAFFLPLAYVWRRSKYYGSVGLVGGSVAIAVVASVWFVQRAFPAQPHSAAPARHFSRNAAINRSVAV